MSSLTPHIWSAGYTLQLPLEVWLDDDKSIVCEQLVRAMPGRRYVCSGYYDGRPAFIKLFAMNRRASREWQSEQVGITALHDAGIAAPSILYAGVLDNAETQLLVYAALADAVSAKQCWEQGDEDARKRLLDDLVELVAKHHAAGLRHKDLHLLNFIYSADVLYTLDASDISQVSRALSRTDSIAGLADLLALLPVEYDKFMDVLYSRYWQVRGDEGNSIEQESLVELVKDKRRYKLRKYLEKVFRTCSAFVARKSWREYVVYDREFESDVLRRLLHAPDQQAVMQQARLLKDGNTCTVSDFELDDHALVCKRYNIKNAWHALSRAFRPSRAAISWKNGHRLLRCGIATPKPVALREQRFGLMRGRAWLFVEKIEGSNLYHYIRHEEQLASDEFMAIVKAFCCLFEKMLLERISHGDMKIGNFIYHDKTLYMIDLDSMQAHDNEAAFARAFTRDMRRFLKNWQKHPATERLFRKMLSQTKVAEYLPSE